LLLAPGFRATVLAQTPPCGSATAPQCDGECPFREACEELAGLGVCYCLPRSEPCGVVKGPPECWGECPLGKACVDASGICECQVVPALSEWGIIAMLLVMFGGVLVLCRRRAEGA
jgi:hypothetical protein